MSPGNKRGVANLIQREAAQTKNKKKCGKFIASFILDQKNTFFPESTHDPSTVKTTLQQPLITDQILQLRLSAFVILCLRVCFIEEANWDPENFKM